jgi:hypothetical protein
MHHLLSWVLSVCEAVRHYPDTCLVTDTEGARLLVDSLGLPFRHVDLRLDALHPACDDEWWVLGKLTAYAAQTAPFIHLDNDVVLWNALPSAVTAAPVFAQNPENVPPRGPVALPARAVSRRHRAVRRLAAARMAVVCRGAAHLRHVLRHIRRP